MFATGMAVCVLLTTQTAQADVPKNLSPTQREKLLSIARQFVDKVGGTFDQIGDQGAATSANGNEEAIRSFPEGEILLLDINLGRLNLNQTVSAMRRGSDLYISLTEFVLAADFPITVTPADGKASGWFIREKQIFNLDTKAKIVTANGKSFSLSDRDIEIDDTDIWVRGGALAQWFGFDLDLNVRMQAMNVKSKQKWAAQERVDRAKKLGIKSVRTPPPRLPRLPDDYKMASVPNASVSLRQTYTNDATGGKSPLQTRMSVQAAGDLLKHSARATVSASREKKIEGAFLTLRKDSEEPNLLGPMKARHYEFGDVRSVPVPYAGPAPTEWGMRASNRDPFNTSQTTTKIEGDAPVGWDVELYRNDQFVAIVRTDENGRYEFDDVFLFAGDNRFRIVKYGTQGEIQEEEQTFAVAPGSDTSGKALYDVSLSAQNTQTWRKIQSRDVDAKTPHLAATFEKQISRSVSAHGGIQARQEQENQKYYADVGVLTTFRGAIVNADAIIDADGFFKAVTAARRQFGKQNAAVVLSYDGENFNPGSGGRPSPAGVTLNAFSNGPVPGFKIEDFGYSMNSNYTIRDNNTAQYGSSLDLTKRLKKTTVSNRLSRSVQEFANGTTAEQVEGELSARGRVAKTLLRGSVGYGIVPQADITEYVVHASRGLKKNLSADASVHYKPLDSYTIGEVAFDWTGKHVNVSPGLSLDSNSAINAGVDVRFGLSQNPMTGNVIMDNRGLVGQGGVTARVFLDKDGDKIYTKGDELLSGVVVEAVQSRREAETDKEGNAYIYNLPANRVTDVQVQEGSTFDQAWIPVFEGVSIRPRPGHASHIDFPIQISGEIDGTIYSATPDGKGKPVRGMHLSLYRLNGKLEQTTMGGPDGFYLFTRVPPGKYFLMVDSEDAKKQKLSAPVPPMVEIGLDGTVLSGQNVILESGERSISVSIGEAPPDYKAQYPDAAVTLPKDGQLVLNLGEYKSGLLLSLVWYRLKSRYAALVGDADLIVPMTATARYNGDTPQMLRIGLPQQVGIEEAHRRCEVLVTRGFSCGVEIVPAAAG